MNLGINDIFRRYFPAVMKDHQSHDVLLMCVRCHQLSNIHDTELRRELAELCDAPIGNVEGLIQDKLLVLVGFSRKKFIGFRGC